MALEVMSTFKDAVASAGISERTGYEWLERGRKARALEAENEGSVPVTEEPYLEFLDMVEDAQAGSKERLLTIVANDAVENAESARWLLRMKFPGEYSERVQVVVQEELDGFLEELEKQLEPDVYAKVLRIAAGRGGR